jgi:hypothetical protein
VAEEVTEEASESLIFAVIQFQGIGMITTKDIKRIKAFERQFRLENGHRSTETQTIPSRKEKESDARRQRKNRQWQKEYDFSFSR